MPRKKIPQSVKKAIKGGLKEPQLAEIAAFFFEAAGGTRQVAKLLHDEFLAGHPGSMVRQRILDLVLRATKFSNEKSKGADDLGILNEADLEANLTELINESGGSTEPSPEEEEGAPGTEES